MKVRMKVDISGTRDGQPWPGRGNELDVPDAEGAAMCAAGLAEPIGQREPAEAAVVAEPVEARDLPRPPTSGPGSGVGAWREYAAAVTGEPVEQLADLSRDELIELVGG